MNNFTTPPNHGTVTAYNYGCRCEECKAEKRRDSKALRDLVNARDGVSQSTQYRRKKKGLHPLTGKKCPQCKECDSPLFEQLEISSGVHRSCPRKPSRPANVAPSRAAHRTMEPRPKDTPNGRDYRSDIRAGIEDGDSRLFFTGLMSRVAESESGCWEWLGQLSKGYPTLRVDGKAFPVHRISCEMRYGKPLGALQAHHICANRICVNPYHLQPVTARENMAEMQARRSFVARIDELEKALMALDPENELLNRVQFAGK